MLFFFKKDLPVCKTGQTTKFYVARGELIQIPCEVEAYPTDLVFQWSFNGTKDFADIPGSHYVVDRLRSSLSYRPLSEQGSACFLSRFPHNTIEN